MNTVTSPDGTPIAYDRTGTGAPLILVGGTVIAATLTAFLTGPGLTAPAHNAGDHD